MTEHEWETSTNPTEMVAFLGERITDEQRAFCIDAFAESLGGAKNIQSSITWTSSILEDVFYVWCRSRDEFIDVVSWSLRTEILRDIVPYPNRSTAIAEYTKDPAFLIDANPEWLTWNDGTIPKMVDAMMNEEVFEHTGPCGDPRCPNCRNSFQNGIPSDHPEMRRCATCKTVWTPRIARIPRAEPRWADMPVIADALESAGCHDKHILEHLRSERCPWCKDGSIEVELCEGACTTKANCSRCKGTGRIKRRHYIGCHIVELLKGTNGETPMNHTTALCGHSVPAWGSPGSPARSRCENEPCDECRRRNTWNAVQLYVAECEAYDVSICGPDGMPKTSEQAVAINRHAKKVRDRLLNEMAIDNLEFTKELRYYWDLEHKKKRNR